MKARSDTPTITRSAALLLALLATTTWSGVLFAGDKVHKASKMITEDEFAQADTNDDDRLDRTEYQTLRAESAATTGTQFEQGMTGAQRRTDDLKEFDKLDENQDGYVSLDEVSKHRDKHEQHGMHDEDRGMQGAQDEDWDEQDKDFGMQDEQDDDYTMQDEEY